MKNIIVAVLVLCAVSSFAAFGGGRSGGFSSGRSSFSSGSRSSGGSFGGFRSSGSGVTIARPAPSVSYSRAYSAPTVVHHYNSGNGMGGFWSGWMMGHFMSRQAYVAGTNGVVVADTGTPVLAVVLGVLFACVVGGLIFLAV